VAFKAGNVSTPVGEDFIGNLWRKKVRRRRGEEIITVLLNDNERAQHNGELQPGTSQL
jgi:hypothetical protein